LAQAILAVQTGSFTDLDFKVRFFGDLQ